MARQVAATVWLALLVSGCSGAAPALPPGPKISSPDSLLEVTPESIDWGLVPAGSVRTAELTLRNMGQSPVKVTRLETSCDCLQVELAQPLLGPGESTVLRLKLDLSREPMAAGNLRLQVTGRTEAGKVAFRLWATVTVTSSS